MWTFFFWGIQKNLIWGTKHKILKRTLFKDIVDEHLLLEKKNKK